VVLTDRSGRPLAVLNADAFLRASLTEADVNPRDFCHKPVVVTDPSVSLQNALTMALTSAPGGREPAVILLWGTDKRIVARTHILESLLRHT